MNFPGKEPFTRSLNHVNSMLFGPVPIKVALLLILFLVGEFVGYVIGMSALVIVDFIRSGSIDRTLPAIPGSSEQFATITFAAYILFFLIYFVFLKKVERQKITLDELGFGRRKDAVKLYCIGLVLAASGFLLSLPVTAIIMETGLWKGEISHLMPGLSHAAPQLAIASAALTVVSLMLVAFVEEMIFRGYVQKVLINKYGVLAGLVLSALIFMLMHLSLTPDIFVFGIVAGLLYIMTRSLWTSIGFHFMSDLVMTETGAGKVIAAQYTAFTLSAVPAIPDFGELYTMVFSWLMLWISIAIVLYFLYLWRPKNMPAAVEDRMLGADRMYAGLLPRLAAFMVDIAIVVIIALPLLIFTPTGNQAADHTIVIVAAMTVEIVYYTVFVASKWQATPGKMIFGLIVVDRAGQRLTLFKAFARAVLKVIAEYLLIVALIGLLAFGTAAVTKKKQAVYDMVLQTYVVKGTAYGVRPKEPELVPV